MKDCLGYYCHGCGKEMHYKEVNHIKDEYNSVIRVCNGCKEKLENLCEEIRNSKSNEKLTIKNNDIIEYLKSKIKVLKTENKKLERRIQKRW